MKRLPMSAESMAAILTGKKDLTSRVVVPQPEPSFGSSWPPSDPWWMWKTYVQQSPRELVGNLIAHAPYRVGEMVALTEGFYVQTDMGWPLTQPQPIEYAANVPDRRQVEDYHYVPAFLMPCWASRQIVTITSVEAGLLWAMTDAEFKREGVETLPWFKGDLRAAYMEWWDRLNAKRGYPSSMNPWRYGIGFRRGSQ